MRAWIIGALCLCASAAWAANAPDPDLLQDEIAAFAETEDARLAKLHLERARALLGTALIARTDEERVRALTAAQKALADAKDIARRFRDRYQALLLLAREVRMLADAFKTLGEPRDPRADTAQVAGMLARLDAVARAFEKGELAEADAQSERLKRSLSGWRDRALPTYAKFVRALLKRAARRGAKRYALSRYTAAKERLLALEAYLNGEGKLPSRLADAARLADDARRVAEEARAWFKDKDSYEQLQDENRNARLALADALGIAWDRDDPLADVPMEAIVARIQALREKLAETRKRMLERVREAEARCADRLAKLELAAREQCGEKIAEIKEAYRAKIEAERKKSEPLERFERLKALFSKKEAEIAALADGSVRIRLWALRFKPGSTWISPQGRKLLAKVKKALDLYPGRRVRIEGHTDNRGDATLNKRLSLARAKAVAEALVKLGVDARRLIAYGYGEARPIASNEIPEGRAMNRRIEIVIEPR